MGVFDHYIQGCIEYPGAQRCWPERGTRTHSIALPFRRSGVHRRTTCDAGLQGFAGRTNISFTHDGERTINTTLDNPAKGRLQPSPECDGRSGRLHRPELLIRPSSVPYAIRIRSRLMPTCSARCRRHHSGSRIHRQPWPLSSRRRPRHAIRPAHDDFPSSRTPMWVRRPL